MATATTKKTTTKKAAPSRAAANKRAKAAKAKAAHPLAHRIPEMMFANDFIGRMIGGEEDTDIIRKARELRHNVIISGPTGSAKTSLLYAVAAEDGLPVVNVACNGAAEPSEMFGRIMPTEDGGFEFVPGEVTLAAMYGGYILLDEVNFMAPRIAAVLHGALDKRRTLTMVGATIYLNDGSIWDGHLHEDCIFVAAYNPGYQGTRPLNEAFKNRFAFKIDYPYKREIEDQLLESDALLDLAWKMRETSAISTPVSTNLLMEFEMMTHEISIGFAVENFLMGFQANERPSVQELLTIELDHIMSELGIAPQDMPDDDDDDSIDAMTTEGSTTV
jgi:MoxR-like ATPase